MISTDASKLSHIIVHGIGNKLNDESCVFSKNYLNPTPDVKELLSKYFLSSFKDQESYNFTHEANLSLNEIYVYATKIFENSESFIGQSLNIAKHLFEQSIHPKIKSGEIYITYFTDCLVDGKVVDAIGIFKSENKDTFLKVYNANNEYDITKDTGININKLDKGCLIFNSEKENGYLVSIVDTTSKGEDAKYWKDDFLHLANRKDNYYFTQNALSLSRNFVTKCLDISKADQAELLNDTVKYFKENDNFNFEDFSSEVIKNDHAIESFNKYKKEYEENNDVIIQDNFDISEPAVKKQSRVFKSVIKLDKNFHIYVHGNNQYIKRGYDESTGLYYYQLFFKEEL